MFHIRGMVRIISFGDVILTYEMFHSTHKHLLFVYYLNLPMCFLLTKEHNNELVSNKCYLTEETRDVYIM